MRAAAKVAPGEGFVLGPVMTETVRWHAVTMELPDTNRTVLVRSKHLGDVPVFLGWYQEGSWFGVDATEYTKGGVIAWAEIPRGPR